MLREWVKTRSWDFYSNIIIAAFSLLQLMRWTILPQFMDIYYHILTAWGFIQAGGYSGWDFWQYAPVGRPHIYPPLFHIILAFFIKLGVNKIILAKLFEAVTPILFLSTLRYFTKKYYGSRLSFFCLVMFSSSFSFYLSLINHLPASLALVLGIFAFIQLFQKRLLLTALFLALCFYTHIGAAYFILLSVILYGLFAKEFRKICLIISFSAVILSSPIIFKQLAAFRLILVSGIAQRYQCEFKTIDYLLALFGLSLIWRMPQRYKLFLSAFLASFIYLIYPYRFFSAQGYLPIIFLSAVSLETLSLRGLRSSPKQSPKIGTATIFPNPRLLGKIVAVPIFWLIIVFILFVSPTILTDRQKKPVIYIFDSALVDMMLPNHNARLSSQTLWYPGAYLPTAALIKANSEEGDIIFSSRNNVGVCLAAISERATANALFPEIGPWRKFDPLSVSKIIVVLQDDKPQWVKFIVEKYGLAKIGENKLFVIYKNPTASAKMIIK